MKKWLMTFVSVVMLLSVPVLASARVVLYDDFETGTFNGWTTYDHGGASFSVVDFNGNKVLKITGSGICVKGDTSWTDYTLEGDVYVFDGSYWAYAAGLLFRGTGVSSFYDMDAYVFEGRPYQYELEKWTKSASWQDFADYYTSAFTPGKWHHMKVVVEGQRIRSYVDDILIFDKIDPLAHLTGNVGFRTWGVGAYFDNIKVTVEGLSPCEQVGFVKEGINALSNSAFINNGPQRKNALSSKLDEICIISTNAENTADLIIRNQYYNEALDKIKNDILTKMDGSAGGIPKNDWIIDPVAQGLIYPKVTELAKIVTELIK